MHARAGTTPAHKQQRGSQHSASVGGLDLHERLMLVGHCACKQTATPTTEVSAGMGKPTLKGRCSIGAKQTYLDSILRDCSAEIHKSHE